MNPLTSKTLTLKDFISESQPLCSGSEYGKSIHARLIAKIDTLSEIDLIYLSLRGIEGFNASFAKEAIVNTLKYYRKKKAFCVVDIEDNDDLDEFISGALLLQQPLIVKVGRELTMFGPSFPAGPTKGNRDMLEYIIRNASVTAQNIATDLNLKLNNASTKLKQLFEQGFVLRTQGVAETGGLEYIYHAIT